MSDLGSESAIFVRALATRLAKAPRVRRLAESGGKEALDEIATEAATSIVDIEHSCQTLSRDILPRLKVLSPESADFEDLLDEIAEEYRHIYYHIANTRLFNYVVPGG